MTKLRAVAAAGLTAAALMGSSYAAAQAYVATYPYTTQRVYVYDTYVQEPTYPRDRVIVYDSYTPSRRAYMEDAGRRWDAMTGYGRNLSPYEADRYFGHPRYPDNTYHVWSNPWPYWGAGRVGATQDSNPSDYATGVYNPKQ